MRRKQTWRWVPAAVLLAVGLTMAGRAEDLAIQSFNGSGRLVFNTLHSASNYRLECATSPSGPWTNAWLGFVPMPVVQAGSVTCSVPVFYRVVATVTNGWLALDVTGDLAFGDVRVGNTATRTLRLQNRGGGPLTVTGIDCPDGFSGNWSGVIQAGYEQAVILTFTPTDNMDYGGTLTVNSDAAGGTFVLAVSGRGASDYLVIDLSQGPAAASYPVSYLSEPPGGGWTDVYKTTKLVMRRLPAATNAFTMGSPSGELGCQPNETQHAVTLSQPFYICVFELTQKQWERVMGAWPSYFNNASYRDARPVEQVSYNAIRGSSAGAGWPASGAVDAASFLGLLRVKTGLAFDLPTESQWEYACRAGTTTALNSGYDLTGTDSDARMAEVGRYYGNGGSAAGSSDDTSKGTAKVGSYLPNAWGLYDMHGNVWEWCLDWYGTYPGMVSDPKGASSGSSRVLRSGSYQGYATYSRSARRLTYPADVYDATFGFRVAVPPGQQ